MNAGKIPSILTVIELKTDFYGRNIWSFLEPAHDNGLNILKYRLFSNFK